MEAAAEARRLRATVSFLCVASKATRGLEEKKLERSDEFVVNLQNINDTFPAHSFTPH